jgi:hypothetical protein
LNDTQFVEASRALGERLAKRTGNDEAKLRWAFLEVVSREPTAKEISVVTKSLARERTRYAQDVLRAQTVLAVGESPRDAQIPAGEHAAWMQVATLLLNLSEAVTRN